MRQPSALTGTLFFVVLAWCAAAFASNPEVGVNQYAHTTWRVRDGFFKGAVWAIAQTPDGYIWLGTEFGLLRFDGVRAVPWQPPGNQSLPSTDILSLLVARDGTLWIGTAKGLASWKDGRLVEQYGELAGHFVFRLLEDDEGMVWASSWVLSNGWLCEIGKGSVQCKGRDGALGRSAPDLYEDSKHNFWAGVQDGLWRLKPGSPKFYSVPGEQDGIHGLAEDDDGALLIGTHSGIRRFVDGKTEPYRLSGTVQQFRTTKLLRDRDGGLWIGTSSRGVINAHQGTADVFGLSAGLSGMGVVTLFEDREGDIWVSTINGLDRFRDLAVATLTPKGGLSNTGVASVLAATDGSVWIATYVALDRWKNGQIPAFGGRDGKLNQLAANSLFQDSHGRIWVSTPGAFGHLENDRFIAVNGIPGGSVHGIAEDRAGNLWIANEEHGLFRLSPRNEVQQIPWASLGQKDNAVAIAADPLHGGLWVGLYQGGVLYFSDGQVRATYKAVDGLGDGTVNRFQFDLDGTVWAATEGGLSRLKSGRVATLTSKNGLPCDAVHWVIQDNDHAFWLFMACGLVRVARPEIDAWAAAVDHDGDTKRTIQASVLDNSDGVTSQAIPYYYSPQVTESSDGKLWFVNLDGVSTFDPRHLPFNKVPPPVHIEQITADRKTYDPASYKNGYVSLPARVRDLAIDYTALSFVASEKVHFRFKLEGQDTDWREVINSRHVEYSNLAPKRYRFLVKASNNSGVWNETGASMEFSIAPAYYQTTWFRLLCGAALLPLLWALYQLHLQKLRRQFAMRLAERARIVAELRKIIDSIPGFVCAISPEGEIELVNQQLLDYFGKTFGEMKSWAVNDAIHPDDRARSVAIFKNSIKTGVPHEIEQRYRRNDGVYRWFQRSARPVRDEYGRITGWYVLITDIEDRKRAEDELQRKEEALGNLRSELAHMARVTSLGALTASIAHEVSQPLSGIITNASTCLRFLGTNPPNLDGALETARRTIRDGNRASEVILRLRLLFSKKEAKTETVDLNEAASEILALCADELQKNRVTVRQELANDLPLVEGDRVQIQQVIHNLLRNASDAMSAVADRRRDLIIMTETDEDSVRLTVQDTGVGITAQDVERLFDPFYTTKSEGMGIGLSVSRSIIESHRGRLWAAPNDGPGATFSFSLPSKFDNVARFGQ